MKLWMTADGSGSPTASSSADTNWRVRARNIASVAGHTARTGAEEDVQMSFCRQGDCGWLGLVDRVAGVG
jgi:hypothetical protein